MATSIATTCASKNCTAAELTKRLKQESERLGFVLAGATPAVSPTGITFFRDWLSAGYAGEMKYLVDRADCYEHPKHVLEGVRSILMLAMPYRTVEPAVARAGEGKVSRYAWGPVDYHNLIHERLKKLAALVLALCSSARVRGVVDTAPFLEREFAQLAGLGWIGKNTLLLNKQWGSWIFLAALLTDQELEYDQPFEADHCGTCQACLDACPTQAFPRPYVLDATRCISYLTIELRDSVPEHLRVGMGDWLFGCDICQDVCPWNHKPPATDEIGFQPRANVNPTALADLFSLSEDGFRTLFRRTPLWRAKRRGILRNAAIVLGNQRCKTALTALQSGCKDDDPVVRDACEWAISQMV